MSEPQTSRVRRVVLSIGAVLGAAAVLFAVASMVLDTQALIFRSGSMSPEIRTGALALAQTVGADELAVGDVVSVASADGSRVTHRIVDLALQGKQATLTLQGDANPVADAEPYVVSQADRVMFDVPYLGYVVAWMSSPVGLFALGIHAAFLVSVIFGRGGRTRPESGRRRATAGVAGVALLATTAVGAGVASPQSTLAAWTDEATVTSGALAAHFVQRPASISCDPVGSRILLLGMYPQVSVSWPHKDARYDYVIRAYTNGGEYISGTEKVAGPGAAGVGSMVSQTYSASELAGLITLGSPVHIRVFSRLKNTQWEAESYRSWKISTGLLPGLLGVDCDSVSSPSSDSTGPTITFTAPTAGSHGGAVAYQDVVRTACGDRRPGCGTVSDPSGVKSVTYQLQRTRSSGTDYFHASSALGGHHNSDPSFDPVEVSSGVWKVKGHITTAYLWFNEPVTYTLTIKAVDNYDNESSASVTFTLSDPPK